MRKVPTCTGCAQKEDCRALCPKIEKIVEREERHFQGREILLPPKSVNTILTNNYRHTLSDWVSDDLKVSEIRIIPGLTSRQLRIMTLSAVHGRSHRAIARSLGISQSTVGEHMLAARRKARRFLEERLRPVRRSTRAAGGGMDVS